MDKKIIPAILTDSTANFKEMVGVVESFADYVQIDYVDGYFAPEITCCEAKVISEINILPAVEVHLMVEEPILQVKEWYRAGVDRIVGHIEEMDDQIQFVERVSRLGLEVGLAINIETEVTEIEPKIIPSLNLVLLMAHEVGVQGAKFNPVVIEKITYLRKRFPRLNIEVDGGVNSETITLAYRSGANYFAVGSDLFEADDPAAQYAQLLELIS